MLTDQELFSQRISSERLFELLRDPSVLVLGSRRGEEYRTLILEVKGNVYIFSGKGVGFWELHWDSCGFYRSRNSLEKGRVVAELLAEWST